MAEKEEKVLTPEVQNTYENEDVKALQKMEEKYNAELQKKDLKYSALLKFVTEGGKVSPETPAEPTPEERRKHIESIARAVRDNKIPGVEQAKALVEYDDYVVKNGGRTIFTYTDGEPSANDITSAENVKALLQYGIETSEGNEELFQAAIASKLKDIK